MIWNVRSRVTIATKEGRVHVSNHHAIVSAQNESEAKTKARYQANVEGERGDLLPHEQYVYPHSRPV